MRLIACIAVALTCFFTTGSYVAARTTQVVSTTIVIAATDSSGVSITIDREATTTASTTAPGRPVITITNSSTDETVVCTIGLGSDKGNIRVRAGGSIQVTWNGTDIAFDAPSIRMAGVMAEMSCEEDD
jgi:hypothetical protein